MKNSRETLDKRNKKRKEIKNNKDLSTVPKYKDKICIDCKILKPCRFDSSFFAGSGEPEYRSKCDVCLRKYQNALGAKNRKKLSSNAKITKANKKKECVRLLGGKCERCGYDKCMGGLTFHHLNPDTKNDDISRLITSKAWKTVLEELKQCILLCFNCHMEEEYYLRNGINDNSEDDEND